MKFIEKLILIIFSLVVLCMAILMIVYRIGIIGNAEIKTIYDFLTSGQVGTVVLVLNIVLILIAIKNIFIGNKSDIESTDGILMENDNGKLLITKNTLENLVNSITKNVVGAESTSSRIMLDKEKNIIILVTMVMTQENNIKFLINKLQSQIKDTIKQTVDLDVKEVNIKIKNIAIKQNEQKALPAKNESTGNNANSFKIESKPIVKDEIKPEQKIETEVKTEEKVENKSE